MRGQIDFPLHPGSSYSGLTDWRHVEEEDPGHRLCLLIGSSILNPLTLLKLYYSVSSMLMIEAIDTPWYGNNLVQMSWMRREGVEGCIRCIFVRGKKHQKATYSRPCDWIAVHCLGIQDGSSPLQRSNTQHGRNLAQIRTKHFFLQLLNMQGQVVVTLDLRLDTGTPTEKKARCSHLNAAAS